MDKECREMIEKLESLEEKRDECISNNDLDGAVKTFRKIVLLDRKMADRCGDDCSCEGI